MKALTLTQPWASLVAVGAKRIETRSWPTHFTGRIAIHAAKTFPEDARYLATSEPFTAPLGRVLATELPTAAIVAVAMLEQCWQFDENTAWSIRSRSMRGKLPPHEADFGDFSAGRYGFVLDDVVRLATPITGVLGKLGLWNLPSDIERQVLTAANPELGEGSR